MNASETGVAAAIMIGGLIIWFVVHWERRPRYRQKTFLVGCELEFFRRLQQALPQCLIFPHVAIPALIEPVGIGNTRKAALALIENRRVGYAVFDQDMWLLAVVELNHRSRRTRGEVARDGYFTSAGIRALRFNAQRLPSEAGIQSAVFARQETETRRRIRTANSQRGTDIEFKRATTPWRNTANIHL